MNRIALVWEERIGLSRIRIKYLLLFLSKKTPFDPSPYRCELGLFYGPWPIYG